MERTHLPPSSSRTHRAKRTGRRRLSLRLRPWMLGACLVLLIGMMLTLAVGLVLKAVKPYREARQQGRQLSGSRASLAEVNADNAALRQRIAYLQTPEGQMTQARKLGYVRPGEVPYVVEDGGVPVPPPVSHSAPAAHSWWPLRGH